MKYLQLPPAKTLSGLTYLTSLKELIIPYGCETINHNGFCDHNTNMKKVEIPSSVTSMYGYQFFRECVSLKAIIMNGVTPPTLAMTAMMLQNSPANIYVPDDFVNTYKTATNWSALSSRIKPLSEFVEE